MRRPLPLLLLLVAAGLVVAACGSADDSGAPPAQPPSSGRPADFPSAKGRTMQDLLAGAGESLVLVPTVQDLDRGMNRYGFALFDVARKQVTGARVALYVSRPDGTGARGPYIARSESLKVTGPFQSRTTASDPDAAKSVYVTEVPFRREGRMIVSAIAKLDGRLVGTNAFTVQVGRPQGPLAVRSHGEQDDGPPDVGEKAIRVHTETLADVGGDASRISTRNPPAEDLLKTDMADVLGKRPVVITFATPQLCQSRVCGPVVDIVAQVHARVPRNVAFIHQEIYNDNEVKRGLRPQVVAWHLLSEPWTFVIDRRGRIAARFEGAFSAGELQRAIAKVT